jgi:hypothetical protein
MVRPFLRRLLVLCLIAVAACSASTAPTAPSSADAAVFHPTPQPDGAVEAAATSDAQSADSAPHDAGDATLLDAPSSDAGADADKAARCAATFGDALSNAFGRLDGTVLAVVPPADDACADINGTHLVIQVTVAGVAYRMVLDVLSTVGSPDVFFYEEDAPLVDGAWSEGWHAGVALDYVTTLSLTSTQFADMTETPLVDKVTSEITVGSHISVFATSQGEPSSAHLIHRNLTNQDGAIVVRPDTGSPHYLLFHFADQTF